ncbi:MAG: helix-turn-helix domain-containing protein, partial [Candidatus Dormiibacterota bacterium]
AEEVRARAARAASTDPVVDALVALLDRPAPALAVVALASSELGVGERRLHRRCVAALGYGPKTLHRVLRFQRALRLSRTRPRLVDLAADAGYADQAHLARECRRMTGLGPSELFKTTRTWPY